MKNFYTKETITTTKHTQIYDITEKIISFIKKKGLKEGHIIVQVLHTTVGVYVNENEKRLLKDFINFLDKKAPIKKELYLHDDIEKRSDCPPDEPTNGHSHIKSAFYSNPSVSLIFYNGQLQLGKYQRIFFAEFDGPCPRKNKNKREYLISIIGK